MPRDPKVNSLVRVEAKKNKLEGTIDVLQDRPRLAPDLSGSYVVLENQEAIFATVAAYPNGKNPLTGTVSSGTGSRGLNYQPFRRGMNPAVGVFGSPFQPIDFNLLQTFEEASNLEDRYISGTTRRAFLSEEGKYADNALPYKRREFTRELDIKWSGRKIDGLAPLTTSVGAYSTVSPNWQRALSPSASPQFQSGNLWTQQPIENLWGGDEVIWKLTSGSGFERGDRVGRNLITGIVGPTGNTLGSIPVIDGIRTTGSSVAGYGTGTSQDRFLAGGAIRDNSSSRTIGSHFRPNSKSTIGSGTRFSSFGARSPYYEVGDIEHSGRLILGTERKTWDFQQNYTNESRTDEQPRSVNKLRSAEYTAEIPPIQVGVRYNTVLTIGSKFATFQRSGSASPTAEQSYQTLGEDYEGTMWLPYETTKLSIDNALTSSLAGKSKTFLYSFTGSFRKSSPESTFLPVDGKLHLGSPVRFYPGGIYRFSPHYFTAETFGKFEDFVLLTSRGQVFLKRDLGFTNEDFNGMHYLDFSDPRLFFAQEEELDAESNSNIQIKNIHDDSWVEVAGGIGIFNASASNADIYSSIALQYYKKPAMRHFYFGSTGHVAHHMGSDSYSYIKIGDTKNPSRDPGFIQANGGFAKPLAYDKRDDIVYAVEKTGVSKFYFTVYNPQLGQPYVISSKLRKINNLVSEFSNNHDLSSSLQYNFPNASSLDFSNKRTIPLVGQALAKRHRVNPVNTEEFKNLQDIGFTQEGEAPIVRFSEKYQTETDAFGNGYLSDIPSDYIPYFDHNGNVEALFGSSIAVQVSDRDGDDAVEVGVASEALLGIMARTPNFPVNFDSNTSFGYAPYNTEEKNGIAYRAILGRLINKVSGSWLFWKDYSVVPHRLTNFPLPRIGSYVSVTLPLGGANIPNSRYWGQAPVSLFFSCDITSSNFMPNRNGRTEYPSCLIVGQDKTTNRANGFSDYDRGIISNAYSNPTKNKLNNLNSDVIIHQDQNGLQTLGVFIATPQEDISQGLTSSIAMNYIYDQIPLNSNLVQAHSGFTSNVFEVNEDNMNSANKMFIKENPIFALEMRGPIRGFNQFGGPTTGSHNKMAFACYTISDAETLYSGSSFNSESLYRNTDWNPIVAGPTIKPGVVGPPQQSFLNIPLSQSYTTSLKYPGCDGASIAFLNSRSYLNSNFNNGDLVQHYASNLFFIHPKGGLNYAFGPTDYYFGTAVQDDSSIKRQITKKISLYVENSLYQDRFNKDRVTPDTADASFPAKNFRGGTFETTAYHPGDAECPLFGIPAGNYSWVMNIQDMIPPLNTVAWLQSEDSAPPKIFGNESNNGLENGLRSNFYWNIPECEINKSMFSGSISEIRNDNEIIISGKFRGIDGPDYQNALTAPFHLTYGTGSISLRISEADDIIYDSKPESFTGPDQYKGVFVPNPKIPSLGKDGLNIEGDLNGADLPNGERAQPFKKIRVDLLIDKTIPMSAYRELCKLAVSFRPNSELPDEIMEPRSSDGLTLDTWSPYAGDSFEDVLKFNTGEAFCFARISSICMYQSRYVNFEGNVGAVQHSMPSIIGSVPYDPFGHDTENTNPFYQYEIMSAGLNSGSLVCHQTPLGYHSLLSFGESCSDFTIGDLTQSLGYKAYDPNLNSSGINRSIIDQGNSINIINLAGSAVKSEERND